MAQLSRERLASYKDSFQHKVEMELKDFGFFKTDMPRLYQRELEHNLMIEVSGPDGLEAGARECLQVAAGAGVIAAVAAAFTGVVLGALGSAGEAAIGSLKACLAAKAAHCARIYNKSLLYLVSNAFETRPRIPLIRPDGVPLLGMARFVEGHAGLRQLIQGGSVAWIQAPNANPEGAPGASASAEHGGFDDDKATVASTLAFILGGGKGAASIARAAASEHNPKAGSSRIRALRSGLEQAR